VLPDLLAHCLDVTALDRVQKVEALVQGLILKKDMVTNTRDERKRSATQ
jgi:hypothetical protein